MFANRLLLLCGAEFEMGDFNIREASLADKEAVLAINDNIYDGLDYLPAMFDYFLDCPNVKGYVGEIKGEIIAFSMSFLVDDGRTVISRSGRVSQKHAGKGIYSLLQKHVLKSSGAEENAFTTLNINPAVVLESFQKRHTLIVQREMSRFSFNLDQLTSMLSTDDTLKQVTEHDLVTYMQDELHRKYILPNDVIVVDWVPYRLLPSNIPLMGVPEKTNIISNVDAENQTGLLTFITIVQTQDPMFTLNLDIYGSDALSIDIHITAQVNFVRKHTNGRVCFLVFCDERLGKTVVDRSFERLGMTNEDWKLLTNTGQSSLLQMVFRKPLNS